MNRATRMNVMILIDWSILGIGCLLYLLAFVAGFSYDIERRSRSQRTLDKTEE